MKTIVQSFHFLQARTINCLLLFQTKVVGQWYIIPSTCDVPLDFQTKIEGRELVVEEMLLGLLNLRVY